MPKVAKQVNLKTAWVGGSANKCKTKCQNLDGCLPDAQIKTERAVLTATSASHMLRASVLWACLSLHHEAVLQAAACSPSTGSFVPEAFLPESFECLAKLASDIRSLALT